MEETIERVQDFLVRAMRILSYNKLATATGFSTRQLWAMMNGFAPACRNISRGKRASPIGDDRWDKLAAIIGADPATVRAQAEKEWREHRARVRGVATDTHVRADPMDELARAHDDLLDAAQRYLAASEAKRARVTSNGITIQITLNVE